MNYAGTDEYEESRKNRTYHVDINPEYVDFRGIDMGGKVSVFYRDKKKIIFKIGGCNAWSGLGNTTYYSPQYYIGTLKKEGKCYNFHCQYEITYTKKTMKKGKERAMELLKLTE